MLDFNTDPESENPFPQHKGAEEMPTESSYGREEERDYQQAVESWENEGGAILPESA